MHVPQRDLQLLIPLAMLIPLGTAMALVPLRGHVSTDVIALLLALTVVAGGVLAGRAGGIAAALMAAVGFDFFFTQPYLSLKIADGNDILTTLVLLMVGLAVGSQLPVGSGSHTRARGRPERSPPSAPRRG